MVEMHRLRIVGERRNEDIVGLGDGAGDRVADAIANFPFVEITPCYSSGLEQEWLEREGD